MKPVFGDIVMKSVFGTFGDILRRYILRVRVLLSVSSKVTSLS